MKKTKTWTTNSACYFRTAQCVGEHWQCKTCSEHFCEKHFHVTAKGKNVECASCERERLDAAQLEKPAELKSLRKLDSAVNQFKI